MKKFTQTILSCGAFAFAALFAHADSTPKIYVIDMQKVLTNHYEYKVQAAKLKSAQDKASAQLSEMAKELETIYNAGKEANDESLNPTTTPEAKAKAQEVAQEKSQEYQSKREAAEKFRTDTVREMQQASEQAMNTIYDEITKVATEVALRHGATLVFDKSARGLAGFLPVVYSDASYDLTAEVQAEVDKNKPADLTVPSVTPDAAPAPSSSDAPKINVPNVTP